VRCERFDTRLDEVLDARDSPLSDRQLRAHALGCSRCGRRLATISAVLSGLPHSIGAAAHPLEDGDRAAAQRGTARVPRRPHVPARGLAAAVAAGAVAAAILLATFGPGHDWSPRVTQVSVPRQDASVGAVPGEPRGALPAPTRFAPGDPSPAVPSGRASLGLEAMAVEPVPAAPTLPPAAAPPAALSLAPLASRWTDMRVLWTPEAFSGQPTHWVGQFAGGFRPLAHSFGSALSVLRRTLPMGSAPDHEPPQARRTSLSSLRLPV